VIGSISTPPPMRGDPAKPNPGAPPIIVPGRPVLKPLRNMILNKNYLNLYSVRYKHIFSIE
jgi:hypothetical protein